MTRKRLSWIALALIFCAGAAYSLDWLVREMRYRALLADRAMIAGERPENTKSVLDCPAPEKTLAFVVFGQSNAANHGSAQLRAPSGTYDFFEGRCYRGDDPQYSATGKGGSPWPAFAVHLRAGGETRPILMANVAVGNTRADQWVPGAEHADKLRQAIEGLRGRGYRIEAALFLQGEADRETPEATYLSELGQIAGALDGIRFIPSKSSICSVEHGPAEALNRARSALAQSNPRVVIGPDTDVLGQSYRSDGCHFNERGLRAVGELWAKTVLSVLEK